MPGKADLLAEHEADEAAAHQATLQDWHAFNLVLLDQVFDEFLRTNLLRGTPGCKASDLLSVNGRNYAKYMHLSIPYLCTVERNKFNGQPSVFIRLSNNGYQYEPRKGTITRHGGLPGWVLLPVDSHLVLPKLCEHFGNTHNRTRVFYNSEEQRLDIQLQPIRFGSTYVEVSFERGSSYVDDDYPWRAM